tara:strand:+ start:98 stop:226 length:129 start_codon:yes stop_codon:yes gene_type:complete
MVTHCCAEKLLATVLFHVMSSRSAELAGEIKKKLKTMLNKAM